MKCPQCGRWNRATAEKCFYCGEELPILNTSETINWKSPEREDQLKNMPQGAQTVIYEADDESVSRAIPRPDDHDRLAREMQSLHIRRKRGEEQLRQVQQHSAQSGYVPLKSNVQGYDERVNSYVEPKEEELLGMQPEGDVRPDAIYVPSHSFHEYQEDDTLRDRQIPLYDSVPRQSRVYTSDSRRSSRRGHGIGVRRFAPFLAVFFFLVSASLCAYLFIIKPLQENQEPSLQEQVRITATILNDMAAHTIDIPAPDGSQIYIKELKKSYISAAGYASVTVPDYTWYELKNNIESDTMDVTLTPYIKTSAGEQKLMEVITYTIDVPLSPITLVTPDTTYMEVTTSPFQIKFKVEQNSTVFINGADFSSFVNTQDGYITYNAAVPAVGTNEFKLEVQSEYCRKNTVIIQLYRAPQAIPLELDATLSNSSADQLMTIKGTTIPGATIAISTPYEKLDTSKLSSTGEFSFKAKFEKIGTNQITITARKGEDVATLTKEVYYLPYASTYTPKAWAMDSSAAGRSNYLDYLNNTATRVARTQIYVCSGEIVDILSHRPQLAIMDTNPSPDVEQLVLLENLSSDTWEIGKSYRVYGDAYGVYSGMPRLVGRYTYPPLK
ncbi:MAG: hypothetical protein IKW00_07210 [Clostridia bacterium]|nr:hypothetical protein [Clostridia bacterium]